MSSSLLESIDADDALPEHARIENRPDATHICLRNVSWPSFLQVITAFPDRSLRASYDGGTFEIMNIGIRHGRGQSFLSRLVATLAVELDIELDGVGNMTCLREDLAKGIEPDDSWYVGEHAVLMRDREQIDLAVDPPPDLAVEMEVSRIVLDRLAILSALRVPEVWRTDGKSVAFLLLQADSHYGESPVSRAFPGLASSDLTLFFARWKEAGANTAIREFAEWIRENLPRP